MPVTVCYDVLCPAGRQRETLTSCRHKQWEKHTRHTQQYVIFIYGQQIFISVWDIKYRNNRIMVKWAPRSCYSWYNYICPSHTHAHPRTHCTFTARFISHDLPWAADDVTPNTVMMSDRQMGLRLMRSLLLFFFLRHQGVVSGWKQTRTHGRFQLPPNYEGTWRS